MPSTIQFAIVGAAGFVAPRHMHAIHVVGGDLVAALDPHDAVGRLDQFGYDVDFFTEPERFERYLQRRRRTGNSIHWLSVCSPNYLHDDHVRMGLHAGANVLCEKPLVLSPWNLDQMSDWELQTGKRVYTVLQLRLHPAVVALKQALAAETNAFHEVRLVYSTPRGCWYHRSWKGDVEKSGGLVTNIGIHLLDLLLFLFGPVREITMPRPSLDVAVGTFVFDHASVTWNLSIDPKNPPDRHLEVDGLEPVSFSHGFAELHDRVYANALAGVGCGIEDARPAVELAHKLRNGPYL